MRQRDHFGEAMSGIPGAFLGEAIRTLIQIDALQTLSLDDGTGFLISVSKVVG
jgi:hypothetical protein